MADINSVVEGRVKFRDGKKVDKFRNRVILECYNILFIIL